MSSNAVIAPIAAPCQRNCSSASPTARTTGLTVMASLIVLVLLALCGQQLSNFAELIRRGTPAGQRLDHQLRGRPAERAVHQVEHEPMEGFLFGMFRAMQ